MAPLEVIGNGDYALNFSAFDDQGFLEIVIANTSPGDEICFVWHGFGSNENAAVKVFGDSNSYVGIVGVITDEAPIFKIDKQFFGVVTIIVNGYLKSRCALYGGEYSVNDCFALPLPLYARGDGESNLAMTIQGSPAWAGWQSALPAGGVVRMTGFNLPRTLTSYSGATPTTITAEGGDYGIEFTIPQDSDSVAIFDETFWLYIR